MLLSGNVQQPENHCTTSGNERQLCEGLLTAADCLESLKNMETSKTPGTEAIPAEFQKAFNWNNIKPF